jgi:hypothetical protein
MEDWQPLNDIWSTYVGSLDAAIEHGYIDDPDLAQDYVWPVDLQLSDDEQQDLQKYTYERQREVIERVKSDRGVNPNLIAGYIFRSVIVGMMWERDRKG